LYRFSVVPAAPRLSPFPLSSCRPRPSLTHSSIFAQNNGVIALTRCANRKAGYVCASFLILYGGEWRDAVGQCHCPVQVEG
jgi:hypothetical protein